MDALRAVTRRKKKMRKYAVRRWIYRAMLFGVLTIILLSTLFCVLFMYIINDIHATQSVTVTRVESYSILAETIA
jgi:hypothetical protein